ncbi:hypothetical protein [Sphingomonas sp.]|jgi:hypothetical protein|uniref:hypothetical protein n=1 Tax=Sphingomonas sp. TaxID=28214 RepID=UPI002DE7FEA4|nr:hypothetical protein [Sphingomonas sp.]
MSIVEHAVLNPVDWSTSGIATDWRSGIGERTRQLWDTFSNDLKIALAKDAQDLLLAGPP